MPSSAHKKALSTAILSLTVNFILAIIKGISGFFGNSFALMADALESLTDVVSSMLVILGLRYSIKPPDDNHPYGHGKIEPFTTFIVVGFLLISAVFIAYQSVQNILTPHEVPENYTLIILVLVFVFKELFFRFEQKKGEEIGSTVLMADAWHHRSDAITSFIAFIGIAIAIFFGKGFEAADDWAALIASAFIVYNAFRIFRPALGEILDEKLHEGIIEQIRISALAVEGAMATEKCHVRKSGLTYFIDLHLIVDGNLKVHEGHEIAHMVKDEIQQRIPEVSDVLIHVEPFDTGFQATKAQHIPNYPDLGSLHDD